MTGLPDGGYPHVQTAKGQYIEARIGGKWVRATVTWVGSCMIWVKTEDGQKHEIPSFTSYVRDAL